MNITLQIKEVTDLLATENDSITVIGLLLAVCGLLIWDKVRQEKTHKELAERHDKEQADNKDLLIELVRSGILATEKNTQAINTIKDAIEHR